MLDEQGNLVSDLWLDQPDAAARIERRVRGGVLPADRADRLKQFVEQGYVIFELPEIDPIARTLDIDVDRLWRERPTDLAYVFVDQPTSLADASERRERMAPTRILDLHAHAEGALRLYLHPEIFAWTGLILDREPIAFESAFNEFGWSAPPCRDAVYIPMDPSSHLLTAWVALEDLRPENGPVYVIPGSHRLPFYRFEEDRFQIRPDEDYLPAHRFVLLEAEKRGLEPLDLHLEKGQVLLRHTALVHGARRILRPWVTRRSMMIRLTDPAAMASRKASYWKTVRGKLWRKERRLFWNETRRFLEREGCRGFDGPLRGMDPRGLSLGEKLMNRLRGNRRSARSRS